MTVPHLTHPSFQYDKMGHGFFGRKGGVSENSFASLNCGMGSGDLLDNVYENHRRIANEFNLDTSQLLFCKQIHSNKVVTVNETWERHLRPEADAMVTKLRHVALAVMSADCAPVLFYDQQANIIGAAHSGWRGAFGGVLDETIVAMEQLGASRQAIHVCIGPCVQQASYEVSQEFYDEFMQADNNNHAFFIASEKPEHYQFNLPRYAQHRLSQLGITHISILPNDTLSDEENFFSYRRRTLRDELQNGIQMSVITLR